MSNPDPVFMALETFQPQLEMNRKAFAYWASLPRKKGRVPLKTNCDILEVADLLPTCLILDLEGPTEWPIRLFGTDLEFHFGLDATGMNGFDLYDPIEQKLATKRIAIMCDRRAVMKTHTALKSPEGVTVETEWVFLPLSNDEGRIERVLISIEAFESTVERHEFEMDGTLQTRRVLKLIYACD